MEIDESTVIVASAGTEEVTPPSSPPGGAPAIAKRDIPGTPQYNEFQKDKEKLARLQLARSMYDVRIPMPMVKPVGHIDDMWIKGTRHFETQILYSDVYSGTIPTVFMIFDTSTLLSRADDPTHL